jgi:predicted ATP-grasp superfamily ATP-dependent carboligase
MVNHTRDLSGVSVLVTDGHYKHTVGVIRHLGTMNASVDIVSSSAKEIACSSRYCRAVVVAEDVESPAFLETVRMAVTKTHYDVLMPISYKTTKVLAQNRDLFLPHVWMGVTDSSKIEKAANKNCMVQLAKRLGIPIPRTLAPGSLEELQEFSRGLNFPVVVKPQKETAGYSVKYIKDSMALTELYESFFALDDLLPEDIPLLQEYIPGQGCGFFATYQNGECKRVFLHRRIREYPASGGVSTCAESFYDSRLAEYGKRLLDALGWHGVAMVEFRQDARDGEYKLMEVNPKFWGSLELALAAGADFPGDLCVMAMGQELQCTDSYNRNLRFHWPISVSGELYHLWSRPQAFLNVASDFVNPKVQSNIWLSDLGPHYREMRHLRGLLFGRKHR